MDILLTKDNDIYVSPEGDIAFTDSVAQKIRIRLLWFLGEWRWNTDEGLPYFDDILIKNPDTDYIESLVRKKIFEVTEVTEVNDVSVTIDKASRRAAIKFKCATDYETIQEEVSTEWLITA